MKNIKIIKSKYFIYGLIIGLSFLSIGTYATLTQAGTLGNLFEKIGSDYRLIGDNIKDNTIDSSEIENNTLESIDIKDGEVKTDDIDNNAITSDKIKDGEVNQDDIDSSFSLWSKSGTNLYYTGGKIGIGTSNINSNLTVKGAIELYDKNKDDNNTDTFTIEKIEHSNDKNEFNINIGDNSSNDDYLTISSKPSGTKVNLLTVRNNGRVGIGTSNPRGQLDIQGGNMYLGNRTSYGRFTRISRTEYDRLSDTCNNNKRYNYYCGTNENKNCIDLKKTLLGGRYKRNVHCRIKRNMNISGNIDVSGNINISGKVNSRYSTSNYDGDKTLVTKDYVDNNSNSFSDCKTISRSGTTDTEHGKVGKHLAECKDNRALTKITFTSHDNVWGITCCK